MNMRIIKAYSKFAESQIIKSTKTIRSVIGSKIVPKLLTWLNFLAIIPSSESLKPIIEIIKININGEKSVEL